MSILSYTALLLVEALVCLFFYMAGDTIDGNPVVMKGGNLAPPQLPYSLSFEDIVDMSDAAVLPPDDDPNVAEASPHEDTTGKPPASEQKIRRKRKGMHLIVDAMEQCVAELWAMLLGSSRSWDDDHGGGQDHQEQNTLQWLRDLTHLFWLASPDEECNGTINNVLTILLAEVVFQIVDCSQRGAICQLWC